MGLILITHDLRVAFSVADRVYVLYAGSLVEVGRRRRPRARAAPPVLARAAPLRAGDRVRASRRFSPIEGSVPRPTTLPTSAASRRAAGGRRPSAVAARPPLVEVDRRTAGRRCLRIAEIRGEMDEVRHEVAQRRVTAEPVAAARRAFVRVNDLRKVFPASRRAACSALARRLDRGRTRARASASSASPAPARRRSGAASSASRRRRAGRSRSTASTPSDYARLTREDRARLRRTRPDRLPGSVLHRSTRRQTVGAALREVAPRQRLPTRPRSRARVDELLERVGLPLGYAKRRPRRCRAASGSASRSPATLAGRAAAARLRRAGLGARRLGPGADPEPLPRPARGVRPRLPVHHARPRGRPPGRRPRLRPAPRARRRAGPGRRRCSTTRSTRTPSG